MNSQIVKRQSDDFFSFIVGKPFGGEAIDTTVPGLYRQHVIMEFESVTIDSDSLDCESVKRSRMHCVRLVKAMYFRITA